MFKRIVKAEILFWAIIGLLALMSSCKKESPSKVIASHLETENKVEAYSDKKELSKAFKTYWYAGEAEISSYKLEQERYGEMRDGHAILVYVTEDFFDANVLSYKNIIQFIENSNKTKGITCKILPKNSKFALGSDNAISRGEIINFH